MGGKRNEGYELDALLKDRVEIYRYTIDNGGRGLRFSVPIFVGDRIEIQVRLRLAKDLGRDVVPILLDELTVVLVRSSTQSQQKIAEGEMTHLA